MGELAAQTGKKVLAIAVLVAAAYVLFKVLLGVVTAVAWVAVIILALIGIAWAVKTL
jgi:hypothetical protein